jgi:hypothetical protein
MERKNFDPGLFHDIELYDHISDSEALWKATNEVWIAEKAKKIIRKNMRGTNPHVEGDEKDEEDERDEGNKKTEILVEKEAWLQNDFVSFESSFEEDALDYEEDAGYARYAGNSKARNNQEDQMNQDDDFDDDIDDEDAFRALYADK